MEKTLIIHCGIIRAGCRSALRGLALLGIGLMLAPVHAAPSYASRFLPPARSLPPASLAQAETLLARGQYVRAAPLLQSFVSTQGRSSRSGRVASYLLIVTRQVLGRYGDALQEASALLRALPPSAKARPAADVSRTEIVRLQQVLQAQTRQEHLLIGQASAAAGEALTQALRGDLALARGQRSQALRQYRAAFRSLTAEPTATQASRLSVETRTLFARSVSEAASPKQTPGAPAETARALALSILGDPSASSARRQLALVTLCGVLDCEIDASRPTPFSPLEALARAVLFEPAPLTPDAVPSAVRQALSLADPEVGQTAALIASALTAEQATRWQDALSAYQAVVSRTAPASGPAAAADRTLLLSRLTQGAQRAIPLMESLAKPGPTASSTGRCTFLGVDRTVGSEWGQALGSEAWALCAVHEGADLCGGSALLNGSFSYRVQGGEPQNPPRRWRDPPGMRRRPHADLPLSDPTLPGEQALSFLDDNGEEYPMGGGPNFSIGLTIPPGAHILSFPLHFCDPQNTRAAYGLYLLEGRLPTARAGAEGKPALRCLSSLTVSVADAPGYVRAAVQGPGRYTLVIRGLHSLNTNLPALFLDPDRRTVRTHPLFEELSLPDVQAAGLSMSSSASGDTLPAKNDSNSPAALQDLVRQYVGGTADWTALATSADKLAQDTTIQPSLRAVAALVAWHAQERLPLGAGMVAPAFVRFLQLRYASPLTHLKSDAAALLQQQTADLRALARRLREDGRPFLAEQADDAAWVARVRLAQASDDPALTADKAQQEAWLQRLWSEGPRVYLTPQIAWVWQGEGSQPQRLTLALDAGYAARKAAIVTRALLSKSLVNALLAPEPNTAKTADSKEPGVPSLHAAPSDAWPVHGAPAVQMARIWLDLLGADLGLSINGQHTTGWQAFPSQGAAQPADQQESKSQDSRVQPAGLIVYAAACAPLLGDLDAGASDTGAKPSGVSLRPCLLEPTQWEMLARAQLNRGLFPTEQSGEDARRAAGLLGALKSRYPDYPRREQVSGLLAALQSRAKS